MVELPVEISVRVNKAPGDGPHGSAWVALPTGLGSVQHGVGKRTRRRCASSGTPGMRGV